jgi:flagellar biosynthetic protein FliP
MSRRWLVWLLLAVRPAYAAATPFTLFGISESKGAATLSVPMQIIVLLTLGTLLPAAVMCVTPFLRITIVLHFLRQALGTQTMPSNQVLVGLALFLTIVLMRPVAAEMYHRGWEPVAAGAETPEAGFTEAAKPLRHFLIRFAREKDIRLILGLDRQPAPRTPEDLDLAVLIPAYVLSELKAGFQIGAVLFLPFLMIDLVVASVTLSVGMMQLPPVMISAPFKIMLFVLVDGWNLVVGSLMRSFYRAAAGGRLSGRYHGQPVADCDVDAG